MCNTSSAMLKRQVFMKSVSPRPKPFAAGAGVPLCSDNMNWRLDCLPLTRLREDLPTSSSLTVSAPLLGVLLVVTAGVLRFSAERSFVQGFDFSIVITVSQLEHCRRTVLTSPACLLIRSLRVRLPTGSATGLHDQPGTRVVPQAEQACIHEGSMLFPDTALLVSWRCAETG